MSSGYYKREGYLEKIKPYMGKPIIKVITGMRRCGKSFFLKQLRDELFKKGLKKSLFLMIDMEESQHDSLRDYRDLTKKVQQYFKGKKGKGVIFLDEIQEVDQWEKAVRAFLKDDYEVVVTGSNANLLSSEIATLLAGRTIELKMYPLSYYEFLEFQKKKDSSESFDEYMKFGGMPVVYDFGLELENQRYELLRSIYNSVILKDVVARHGIRDVPLLENLLKYTYSNIGNIFSAKSIVDYLKSQNLKKYVATVITYLRYIEEAFAIYKVERFDIKGKRQLEVLEKYYVSDLGIRHSIMGYNKSDIGGILENIIYLELRRRGFKVSIGKYLDREIDFIAELGGEKTYYQVSYLLESEKVVEREVRSLKEIKDNYPKYVLSLDQLSGDLGDGIKWMNIRDFLLESG